MARYQRRDAKSRGIARTGGGLDRCQGVVWADISRPGPSARWQVRRLRGVRPGAVACHHVTDSSVKGIGARCNGLPADTRTEHAEQRSLTLQHCAVEKGQPEELSDSANTVRPGVEIAGISRSNIADCDLLDKLRAHLRHQA